MPKYDPNWYDIRSSFAESRIEAAFTRALMLLSNVGWSALSVGAFYHISLSNTPKEKALCVLASAVSAGLATGRVRAFREMGKDLINGPKPLKPRSSLFSPEALAAYHRK